MQRCAFGSYCDTSSGIMCSHSSSGEKDITPRHLLVCVKNPGFLNVQLLQIACLCSARLTACVTACFPMDPGHRRSPACRLPGRVVPVQLGEACQHTLHSSLFKCPHVSHADHLAWLRVFLIDSLSAQSPHLPPSPQAPLFLHVTRL